MYGDFMTYQQLVNQNPKAKKATEYRKWCVDFRYWGGDVVKLPTNVCILYEGTTFPWSPVPIKSPSSTTSLLCQHWALVLPPATCELHTDTRYLIVSRDRNQILP